MLPLSGERALHLSTQQEPQCRMLFLFSSYEASSDKAGGGGGGTKVNVSHLEGFQHYPGSA